MKAGIVQIALCNEISSNVKKISSCIESAPELGLDLLCFPECSLTGYRRDFGNLNWGEVAKALDGLREEAAARGVTVIIGAPLLEAERVYNAAVVMSANYKLKYFKHVLTDFDKRYFTEGRETLLFEVKGIRCGILVCRDQNSPQLAQEYARAGTKIIFIPAAHYYLPAEARRKMEKNRALPIARAAENGLFTAKANAVGSQDDYVSLGHSIIVNPEGSILCEANEEEETILTHPLE